MKHFLLSSILIGLAFCTKAQTNIFPSSGNVGIGTVSPDKKLSVIGTFGLQGDADIQSRLIFKTATGSTIARNAIFGLDAGADKNFLFYNYSNSKNLMFIDGESGNVGIGTTTPNSPFYLQKAGSGWLITSRSQSIQADQINGIKLMSGYIGDENKWAGVASVSESQYSNQTGLGLYAGQAERIRIASGGNVGIGTTKPTEKLAVNGNIRAREVKVETANWPDYVFEENYRLPSLADLESYIKTNKHLPNMPDQKQVATEGVSLGEMNRKLLEKVEELTLLLIEKEKAERVQNRKIERQEARILHLEQLNHVQKNN